MILTEKHKKILQVGLLVVVALVAVFTVQYMTVQQVSAESRTCMGLPSCDVNAGACYPGNSFTCDCGSASASCQGVSADQCCEGQSGESCSCGPSEPPPPVPPPYPYEQGYYEGYYQGYYEGYYQGYYQGYYEAYYQGYYEGYYQGYYEGGYGPGYSQGYYQGGYYTQGGYYSQASYYAEGSYGGYSQGYYQGYYEGYYQAAYAPVIDLGPSVKRIYQVNSVAYNPTRAGANGDRLTYRITIQNNGTANAVITGIVDRLHPNLADDGIAPQPSRPTTLPSGVACAGNACWNLRIDKDADGIYNEASAGESGFTMAGAVPNLTINLSGTKCTTSNSTHCAPAADPSCSPGHCNNWVVLFDAIVSLTNPSARTEVWNSAIINFTGGTKSVISQRYLVGSGVPKVPQFREISP